MEITLEDIKNNIKSYYVEDLLHACYNYLDFKSEQMKPIWVALLLMKWTYLYSSKSYPVKILTNKGFRELFDSIHNFNPKHISNFIKSGNVNKAFTIIHYQQFYLQTAVHKERFSTQLKLYEGLNSRYDIGKSFEEKTGLSIFDFIFILQLTWLWVHIDHLNKEGLIFEGYLSQDFIEVSSEIIGFEKVKKFIRQLILYPKYAISEVQKWNGIRKEEWQTMERSFFTLFPFQYFNHGVKVIHQSVLHYSINYYVYDYLKINDPKFTTEFGARFEKYIELGLKEIKADYITETTIKKLLPAKHKVVDFKIEENIYIECKAIEASAYMSINPTDDLLYSSLKDSILKAYYEQLLSVTKTLSEDKENWGIILTYKTFFWSQFTDLYKFTKEFYTDIDSINHLPPRNVFIIDIYTWDKIINIIKTKQATLVFLLQEAREANRNEQTRKQQFDMHLDHYNINQHQLSYLTEESKRLEI